MRVFESFFQKYFFVTVAATAIIPATAIFFLLIAPTRDALMARKGDFERATRLLNERTAQTNRLEKDSALLATLPPEAIKTIEEMIPAAKDTEGLLQILEDRAAEFGFILRNLDIAEATEKESPLPQVRVLKLSLSVVGGDYAAFVKFLGALQKTARLLDVTSVSFSAGTGNYAVNAKSYWLTDLERPPLALDADFFKNPIFAELERLRAELRPEPRGNAKPFSR